MAIFLLIHGGAHGGWCWERVLPFLDARGHRVLAPDLPGMGGDPTPLAEVTLAGWASFVIGLAREQDEPVILVGHSLGGPVIGEAAELDPGRVLGLVYLSAILNPAGAATMDVFAASAPILMQNARMTDHGVAVIFDPDAAKAAFYHRSTSADADRAARRLCPQPVAVTLTPQTVTAARWGQLPRAYIECSDDRTIPIDLQRQMQAVLPCNPVVTLDSDHSPFLSMPEALAGHLETIAAGFAARPGRGG